MPVDRSDEWRVQSLRTSIFPPGRTNEYNFKGWEDVVGSPPETSSTHPRAGTKEESGGYQSGQLQYEVQVDRIHWRYRKLLEFDADEMQVHLNSDAFGDAIEWFKPLMRGWLVEAPALARVAFGATIVIPVGSHEEGYEALNLFLPSVEVDPKSREFRYRINRRRNSQTLVPPAAINRLSDWKVSKVSGQLESVGDAKSIDILDMIMVNVELDINSAAEITEIPVGEPAGLLLDELIDLATEIAQEGEIP